MNWTTLTPAQVAALFTAAALLAAWLYFRQNRLVRLRVSTLRFWTAAPVNAQPRRRVRDRSALIACLCFLLLLILAIADIRQQDASPGRSIAIVLDTSLWSQVHSSGQQPWIELERREANRILDSLSAEDRVLLLRAEAAPGPILPFTTDRTLLRQAVAELQPSSTVADLPRALALARSALVGSPGALLIYVGPGMLDDQRLRGLDQLRKTLNAPGEPRLWARLVSEPASIENCGITRAALQRDPAHPNSWHLLSTLTNYGQTRKTLNLEVSLSGAPLGRQQVDVPPGQSVSLAHDIRSNEGGLLQLTIGPADALDADNRALLSLPAFHPVRIALVTADAAFAREISEVLAANPAVLTEVVPPGKTPAAIPDIELYSDPPGSTPRFSNSIWFLRAPARGFSPPLRLAAWNPQHPVTRWIRTHDVVVRRAAPLSLSPADTVLASAGPGRLPLITARQQQGRKIVTIAFDPRFSNLPRQEAFPLLMAGAVEWMTGAAEDSVDFHPAGAMTIPASVNAITGPRNEVPAFTSSQNGAYLLARQTGAYRIQTPQRASVIGVNAPPLPIHRWQPLTQQLASPGSTGWRTANRELWRWLVLLAMIALWLEWRFFYANPQNRLLAPQPRSARN